MNIYNSVEIQEALETILPYVEKPGRYCGGELNQIVKTWDEIPIKVALVFPDIYDLGMANLGLSILYHQLNQRQDVLAERAFAPWVDMEERMRASDLPLFSLESKRPLYAFDVVGISLPYETLYTNALNMLSLSQIPLFSRERDETHPLIIAGGQTTFNPEPMHLFIDAFFIGEGEEGIHDILDVVKTCKVQGLSRQTCLEQLALVWGVYVPSLYEEQYTNERSRSSLVPLHERAPIAIKKRIVAKLPPPPTKPIVPYINIVHERITIEIMRGCTRGCRFCHAGMVNRPLRERAVLEITNAIAEALQHTGYEEVGLLSLSSSDYSYMQELLQAIKALQTTQKFNQQRLSISLPSLRVESFTSEMMEVLQESRRHGFTLAPEAATERLRWVINKPWSNEQLMQSIREMFALGAVTIKLYFMIGLPTETKEDILEIVTLCKAVLDEGRKACGGRAQLNVSIGTFVPKPHTPFQWVACDTPDLIAEKQSLLRRELRHRQIKLSWTNPQETQLEAILSRGDRRLSEAIYLAWSKGCKFDAWQEHFQFSLWQEAFAQTDVSIDEYIHRIRGYEERLPWEHIQSGVDKRFLYQDYEWSLAGKARPDCREGCYGCGIQLTFSANVAKGNLFSDKMEDLLCRQSQIFSPLPLKEGAGEE